MKIVSLHAAMTAFEQGLNNVSKILHDTFDELGVTIEEINLSVSGVQFFDGIPSQLVENILSKVTSADGVIIETTSVLSAPCGIMQTFIEHLGFGAYPNAFFRKKVFVVTVSRDGSEKAVSDYLTGVIGDFGGIDVGKITISENDAKMALSDKTLKEAIEKYAEDLYRVLKQERTFIIPNRKATTVVQDETAILRENVAKTLGHEPTAKKVKASEILQQVDYNSFDSRQEQDINEISRFLANQYSHEETNPQNQQNMRNSFNQYHNQYNGEYNNQYNGQYGNQYGNQYNQLDNQLNNNTYSNPNGNYDNAYPNQNANGYNNTNTYNNPYAEYNSNYNNARNNANANQFNMNNNDFSNMNYQNMNFDNVTPHIKSCQQRTQSLYHYFQPQLANGIEAVIQINVKGDEKFEGYLVIKDNNCDYLDGVHQNPDVTIFADCNVWLDILNGKYTIQKAFMIGQLKVRGNFVLMTKFDQLFKLQK